MASALDLVLQLRKEEQAQSEQQQAALAGGIQSGIDNFIKMRTLNQNEQSNQLTTLLNSAKLKKTILESDNLEKQTELLNTYLNGGDPTKGTGSVPPGTTMKAGPFTVPLNPKLTDSQTSAVAGFDKFDPLVNQIEKEVNSGVLGDGPVKRTYNQFLAEGGGDPFRRILTPDETGLERLASAAAEMKKFAFAEGGKQLSPTEKKVVEAGLSFVGKSNSQIIKDFKAAIDILRQKKKLALGGAEAAKKNSLPKGITEDDIQHTMKKHNMTRDQVIEAISNA